MIAHLITLIFLSTAANAAALPENPADPLSAKYRVSSDIPKDIAEDEIVLAIGKLEKPTYFVVRQDLLKKHFDFFKGMDFSGEPFLHMNANISVPEVLNFMYWLEATENGSKQQTPHITHELIKFVNHSAFSKESVGYKDLYTEIARYLLDPAQVHLLLEMTEAIYSDCFNLDLPGEIIQKAFSLLKIAREAKIDDATRVMYEIPEGALTYEGALEVFMKGMPKHPLLNFAISYADELASQKFHQKYVVAPMDGFDRLDGFDTCSLNALFRLHSEKALVVDCGYAVKVPDDFLFYTDSIYIPRIIFIGDPEKLTQIGRGFLFGCSSLTSLTLPQGVTQGLVLLLDRCQSLQEIFVSAGSATLEILNTDDRHKHLRPLIKLLPNAGGTVMGEVGEEKEPQ